MRSQKLKSAPWYNALTFGQCYAFLRAVAIAMLIIAMFVLGAKAFAHTHLEIELSEHQWDQIEKEDKQQAYQEYQEKGAENVSKSTLDKAMEYEDKNRG